MDSKEKRKIDMFLRSQLLGHIVGAGIAMAAILLLTSGKKAGNKVENRPNYSDSIAAYDDSIAAFDARMKPRVDSLRNKIRFAHSEEEIDYADFGTLIKIDKLRQRLVQKRQEMVDSLEIVRQIYL